MWDIPLKGLVNLSQATFFAVLDWFFIRVGFIRVGSLLFCFFFFFLTHHINDSLTRAQLHSFPQQKRKRPGRSLIHRDLSLGPIFFFFFFERRCAYQHPPRVFFEGFQIQKKNNKHPLEGAGIYIHI